jgi:hypothetical protein
VNKKLFVIGLILGIVAVLAVPLTAFAAGTSTDVTGTLTTTLEVSAPSAIALSGGLLGSGTVTGSASDGTVTCNGLAGGYTLKIESNDAAGKMQKTDDAATKLASALSVSVTLAAGTGAPITDGTLTDQTITTSQTTVGSTSASSTGQNSLSVSVSQAQQATGTAGNYKLTLTFTVTAN